MQTFPFGRVAGAYRISLGGHARGMLILIPDRGDRGQAAQIRQEVHRTSA